MVRHDHRCRCVPGGRDDDKRASPWAHHVVWRARSNAVAGFLTDDGQFLDRLAAVAHVGECGQPRVCLTINPQLGLFSEDLW